MYRAPMKIERGRFAAHADGELLAAEEGQRRQGVGRPPRATIRSTRCGSEIQAGDDKIIQLTERGTRRADGVLDIPVQLRPSAARSAGAAGSEQSGGGLPTAVIVPGRHPEGAKRLRDRFQSKAVQSLGGKAILRFAQDDSRGRYAFRSVQPPNLKLFRSACGTGRLTSGP